MVEVREQALKHLREVYEAKPPVAGMLNEIVPYFEDYLRDGHVEALPLPLLKILVNYVGPEGIKLTANQVCRLFVHAVPYHEYGALTLLENVNFHNVSDDVIATMSVVPYGDGLEMKNPFISEIIALRKKIVENNECGRPRIHDFAENNVCKRCHQAKCVAQEQAGLTTVHKYGDDGRCIVCGEPRCKYDNLHPYNYDGHCHICGKAQASRCDVVGCQRIPGSDKCPICGKTLPTE